MSCEQLVESLAHKLELLANADESAIKYAENEYIKMNIQLKREIATLKKELVDLELVAGHIQFFVPTHIESPAPISVTAKPAKPVDSAPLPLKSESKICGAVSAGALPVDISRLDLRVGKVVEIERHPDADSLYVEKVDLGEGRLRTITSGLVDFVPIERMRGLIGIFMCNLKPVKMRGIESQGMLMCASNDEHTVVEPLVIEGPNPPALGDRVFVEAYPGEPDAQLNPKKKVWEQVKPDMRVDSANFATYKCARWKLKNDPDAVIKCPTIANAQIS